jgi:hypothetical protein
MKINQGNNTSVSALPRQARLEAVLKKQYVFGKVWVPHQYIVLSKQAVNKDNVPQFKTNKDGTQEPLFTYKDNIQMHGHIADKADLNHMRFNNPNFNILENSKFNRGLVVFTSDAKNVDYSLDTPQEIEHAKKKTIFEGDEAEVMQKWGKLVQEIVKQFLETCLKKLK